MSIDNAGAKPHVTDVEEGLNVPSLEEGLNVPSQDYREDPMIVLCRDVRSLTILCQQIKQDQSDLRDTLTRKIDECRDDLKNNIDAKIVGLRTEFAQDIQIINTHIEKIDSKLQGVLDEDHFNPERTIVASNLNVKHGVTTYDQAQALVCDALGLHAQVVRAKRKQSRNGKPGLLKAEFASLDKKIETLRRKQNLKTHPKYKHVYVRASQTHEERVAQNNLRCVIDAIPELKGQYRFRGNGRHVETDAHDDRFRGLQEYHPSNYQSPSRAPLYSQQAMVDATQSLGRDRGSPSVAVHRSGQTYKSPPPSYMVPNYSPNRSPPPGFAGTVPQAPMHPSMTPRPPRRRDNPRQLNYSNPG